MVTRASYPSVRRQGPAKESKGSIVYRPVFIAGSLIEAVQTGEPSRSERRRVSIPASDGDNVVRHAPAEDDQQLRNGRSARARGRWRQVSLEERSTVHPVDREVGITEGARSAVKTCANGTGSTAWGLQPVATRNATSGW